MRSASSYFLLLKSAWGAHFEGKGALSSAD